MRDGGVNNPSGLQEKQILICGREVLMVSKDSRTKKMKTLNEKEYDCRTGVIPPVVEWKPWVYYH